MPDVQHLAAAASFLGQIIMKNVGSHFCLMELLNSLAPGLISCTFFFSQVERAQKHTQIHRSYHPYSSIPNLNGMAR